MIDVANLTTIGGRYFLTYELVMGPWVPKNYIYIGSISGLSSFHVINISAKNPSAILNITIFQFVFFLKNPFY